MKKIIMKDKVFIPMIIIFVIVGLTISIISSTKYKNNQQIIKSDFLQMVENCKNLNKENATDYEVEWCKNAINNDVSEFDTNAFDAYDNYTTDHLSTYFNEFIVLGVIILGSSYYITKYLRNRIILNNITREKYKTIIRKLFLSAWKYALLIPMMLLLIYFIIYLNVDKFYFCKGMSDLTEFAGTIFENNLILLFLIMISKAFILSLIYININLIISRKEHNFIISSIKSYLFIIGLEIFFEIFIFDNFKYGKLFNILELYNYPYAEFGLTRMFILFGMLLISFISLFLAYRNKEKLIIDSEKNDNKEEV